MAIKVLLLTQWFDPEPTFKGMVFARELVKQGFEVEVLTGFPNYPGGKIYSGYKVKLIQKELIDGVHVTRVPLFTSHDSSAMKRIANYGTFAFSALIYGLFGAKKPDVIYAYHPPLTTGITAVLLRIFRRVPVVYDIQDMWPDTLQATGMLNNKKVLQLVSTLCDWVYSRVDYLVVLSPGFKRLLIERGVPSSKIEVIYNWADELALSKKLDSIHLKYIDSSKFNIIFAGNMGKAQALENVLNAASILLKKNSNIHFTFVGGGLEVNNLKTQTANQNLNNVSFIPQVSMADIGGILQEADALLVHLRTDPLFEITIPSKTQAYMSVGKPILMAVNGDAANLVRESGAGVVVPSGDASALALAAQSLADLPSNELSEIGARAASYYRKHLAVEIGVGKFSEIFKKVSLGK